MKYGLIIFFAIVSVALITFLFFEEDHPIIAPPEYNLGSMEITMGNKSFSEDKRLFQKFTLLGYDTIITDSVFSLWGSSTVQIIDSIPFGKQINSTNTSTISKYYLASPPLVKILSKGDTLKADTIYDLGLLSPNEFNLTKDSSNRSVTFHYDTLSSVKIHYINVNYGSLKADYVPIKISCSNFPSVKGGTVIGAGIGTLIKDTSRLFLPYPYYADSNKQTSAAPLSCTVTILNDIIQHKLYFEVDDSSYCTTSDLETGIECESIDLKKVYLSGLSEVKIRAVDSKK